MKVIVAMSGGVDSAVAAARLVDAGHQVVGAHLRLTPGREGATLGEAGRPELAASRDARQVAEALGIPFQEWDMSERFQAEVVETFVGEYAAGRTPNPCLRCNERIKFSGLLDRAMDLGFDVVATGHHARVDPGGLLRRSVDGAKDQSYVLAGLSRWQLAHTLLPLGDTTKARIREEAVERGLDVAHKPDSTDLCFIPGGDTRGFLAERLGAACGDIVDVSTGAVLGRHRGTHGYTIGQRRGLGLRVCAVDRRPRYVVGVRPGTNTVLVGPPEALEVHSIRAVAVNWTGGSPGEETTCQVQMRAHGEPVAATIRPSTDGGLVAALARPVRGIAPGQALVAYCGDTVLCSATITGCE